MTESAHVKMISDLINSGRINFFVGAGISGDKVDLAFPKLLIENWTNELSEYYDMGRLRLETVMQILMNTFHDKLTVLNQLPKYLLVTEPNQNHYLLAYALHNGCTVFTTNFDLLIEIAYWNLYGALPTILINEEGYENNSHGTLIKIHGSIGTVKTENDTLVIEDSRNTMVGALDQVARGLSEAKSNMIQSNTSLNDTIFWGYSCMDDFDIFPAINMMQNRKKFHWAYYVEQNQYNIHVGDQLNKLTSYKNMPNSAKKFEVENVSKILTKTDNIIYGNIPFFVGQLIESTDVNSRHIDKRNIDVLKYFETNEPKNPSHLEIDLLNARLLAHVGAWNKIKQHYDEVFTNFTGNDDGLHKLKIEYIERIIPTDPNQALSLIEDLERDDMQPDTKAYILATKSNILRRLKKLDESKFSIDSAVRISNENLVEPYTKHLVNFYKALWIHLNVANKVRKTEDYSKQLMNKITEGEELFRYNISYFEKEGSFDLSESNKNGLALILLEKGRHLKSAKKDKESTEEFSNAIQILEDISQIRVRYGYFRGAGQACRNIALVHMENQKYDDALQTLAQSEQFYKYAKPFPQSDVDEVYYRYAEVYEKMGEYAKVFDPIELWIKQKRLDKDWHNEGRGLYIRIKALHGTNSYEKLRQAVIRIIDIYQERLSDNDKKREFQKKPYAIPNALETLDMILKINKLDSHLKYKIKMIKEHTRKLDIQNKN